MKHSDLVFYMVGESMVLAVISSSSLMYYSFKHLRSYRKYLLTEKYNVSVLVLLFFSVFFWDNIHKNIEAYGKIKIILNI